MTKKVLIVEDEFIVADDLQLTLKGAGYNVCGIAASVTEARDVVEKKHPDLVLLDIHLKGKLSGIELARELKEKSIAFVYLSANSNQQVLEAAKATEPYGFLVKPFREKDLLITLDIAFYRHEHSLEVRWQKELQLQKLLSSIQQEAGTWEQKMVKTATALQPYVPFDCMAGRIKNKGAEHYSGFAFLRIGFDEYQTIGLHELSVIAGKKEDEIIAILAGLPQEIKAGFYNEEDFEKTLSSHPMRTLFAKTFDFSSNLEFPLSSSDGYLFSLSLFRRTSHGYSAEHIDWLYRLQPQLSAILSSISAFDKNVAVSMNYREQNEKKNVQASSMHGIIGNSPALLNVLDMITQVAPLDTSVLILGESGTGKEKIADSIHQLSPRKGKPLIKINCAAMPPTLIESELFGHEKGAFTGALEKRVGKFEMAEGGTVFLDEIGEMPVELQVKLLRVLQEREIERIGGKLPIKVNVRVIAATNRNLEIEIAANRFRLDLYYRLNVFPVTLPPLRERKEDIEQLAYFFAESFCKKFNKSFVGISQLMLSELEAYDYPGNIRELENVMEKAVILNDGKSKLSLRQPLTNKFETATLANKNDYSKIKTIDDIRRIQRDTEIQHISSVLRKTGGRIRGKDGAAELLNEKPTTLESRMMKLGIKKEDFQ